MNNFVPEWTHNLKNIVFIDIKDQSTSKHLSQLRTPSAAHDVYDKLKSYQTTQSSLGRGVVDLTGVNDCRAPAQ